MFLQYGTYVIRNAETTDAPLLGGWWRDGSVMAHAGFPLGLSVTDAEIARSLERDADETGRRLILEQCGEPVGEMNYRSTGDGAAEIGIKICDASRQNHGAGKIYLSMLIQALFWDMGYQKIVLDTNERNERAQHVYETLGFSKLRVNKNAWKDQLGEMQSSVDYSLYPERFHSFAR